MTRFEPAGLSRGCVAALMLIFSTEAVALESDAPYTDDARCDPIPDQTLTHELGEGGLFPLDELISSSHIADVPPVCVADDGDTSNDYDITITNLSGRRWTNLFFVVDQFDTLGNADGTISDGAESCDALKIDSVGVNPNLISESLNADGVFEVGETWVFRVTNMVMAPVVPVTPTPFASAGFCSVSFGSVFPSHASIVAEPLPPDFVVPILSARGVALLGSLLVGLSYLALRRRARG